PLHVMIRLPPPGHLLTALVLFVLIIFYIDYRLPPQSTTVSYGRSRITVDGRRPRIVVYNRVPKTASTTFTNAIAYDMFKENAFNVVHLNITKNRFVMSLSDQSDLVRNITDWRERQPLFIHGHVAFIDFQRFGVPPPIYINLIREPFERLLSHYYFLRYGDNYRVGLKRARAGNNETFDECISRSGHDCDPTHMWLQIPYFCGQHPFCSEIGSRQALEQAKRTLIDKYLVVGVSDRIRDTVAMLEATIPNFFRGALKHFDSLDDNRAHLRNTKKKIPPSAQTLYLVHSTEVYKLEKEFYDFALSHFDAQFKKATNGSGKAEDAISLAPQYHYEKIKPVNPYNNIL
ncbi:hst-2, partial [Pristionchus pacificus]